MVDSYRTTGTLLTGADLSTIIVVAPVINLMLFPHTLTPPLTLRSQFPTPFFMLRMAQK